MLEGSEVPQSKGPYAEGNGSAGVDKSCDCVHPLRALESMAFTIVLKTEPLGEVQASSTGVTGSGVAKVTCYKNQGRGGQSNTNYNPAQARDNFGDN